MKTGFFKLRLHQLFFYLLILFLPTQLGKHFWPGWTMVEGIRIDYLSPTVYLTDIIILGVLFSWGVEKLFNSKKQRRDRAKGERSLLPLGGRAKSKNTKQILKRFLILSSVFMFLITNSLLAASPPAAFYKLIKIFEFSLLGFYIAHSFLPLSFVIYPLSIATIYSSLIAIFQFLKQASLGGLLWWLGERTFNSMTPGIAQASMEGRLILRPYATFPHPNVLGGFLAVSLVLLISNSRNLGRLIPGILRRLTLVLGTIVLFLTFSRSAWFVFGLSLLFCGLARMKNGRIRGATTPSISPKILLGGIGGLVIIGSLGIYSFFPRPRALIAISQESINLRQSLNRTAFEMIKTSPLLGVGLNNFLVRLPEFYQDRSQVRFLQPTHNIYLLIGAETGLVGLGLFLWFLFLTYRHLRGVPQAQHHLGGDFVFNLSLIIALTSILFLGLFDHYFYTLQQGQLLAALLLGLSWAKKKGVL